MRVSVAQGELFIYSAVLVNMDHACSQSVKKKKKSVPALTIMCTKIALFQKSTWRRMHFTNQLTSFNTGTRTTVAVVQIKFRSQCMHKDFINLWQCNLLEMFVHQEHGHVNANVKINLATSILTSVYF